MAYVATNPAFLERVAAKIGTMCTAELNTLGEMPLPQISTASDFFMDNVWGGHRDLCALMPDDFKNEFHEWRVVIEVDGDHTSLALNTRQLGAIYPPNYSWYNHLRVEKVDYPETQQLLAYLKTKAEIINRWTSIQQKVKGFLEECKSLNEAVKLWPDVVTYIDRGDIERLMAKRAKPEASTRAAEALAALNTDELLGAAVIARLAGAEL